jgi:ribosomal protein S18 acetylase RimI-like enzyme
MSTSSAGSSSARARARAPRRLRPLARADRGPLERILRDCGAFSPEEVRVALDLVDAGLSGDPEYTLLAADAGPGGPLLGYVCFGRSPFTRGSYDLYWIAVDPGAQGRGVGQALLAGVEAAVRESGGTLLLVDTAGKPGYLRTRAFYAEAGYVEEARIRDYYAPGDDRITFSKRF